MNAADDIRAAGELLVSALQKLEAPSFLPPPPPPPTPPPPSAGFQPLGFTELAAPDVPDARWRTEIAPGVKLQASVTNDAPAVTILASPAYPRPDRVLDPLVTEPPVPHFHRSALLGLDNYPALDRLWEHPDAHRFPSFKRATDGTVVAHTPGIWFPVPYDRRTGYPVVLQDNLPIYYDGSYFTFPERGRRLHMLPNGVGYVTMDWHWATSNGIERIHFTGPVGFHRDIQPGTITTPRANHARLWFPDRGPLPPESAGWFATPQLEVYLKTRVKLGTGLRSAISWGGPDTTIMPHLDYVSASAPLGDTTAAQVAFDIAFNQPTEIRRKLEAVRYM